MEIILLSNFSVLLWLVILVQSLNWMDGWLSYGERKHCKVGGMQLVVMYLGERVDILIYQLHCTTNSRIQHACMHACSCSSMYLGFSQVDDTKREEDGKKSFFF